MAKFASLFTGIGLLASAATAKRADGPRVILYNESWAVYARHYHIWDLDDSILARDMPFSEFFIDHAFLYLNPDTCQLHSTDTNADFSFVGHPGDPFGNNKRGDINSYMGVRGWFGIYKSVQARYPKGSGVHIVPSLGGWSLSHGFRTCLTGSKKNAEQSLKNITTIVDYFNFDGVDLDWEYPNCTEPCGCQNEYVCTKMGRDTNNDSGPGDWDKYFTFLRALRTQMNQLGNKKGKKMYISIAAGMNPHLIKGDDSGHPVPSPIEQMCEGDELDFVNLMTYDYFGSWLRKTGPLAPLYDNDGSHDDDDMHINYGVTEYLKRCKNPSKLHLGLATYSKAWRKVPKQGDVPGMWQESTETVPSSMDPNVGWLALSKLDAVEIENSHNASAKTGTFGWYELAEDWLHNPSCKRTWLPGSEVPTLFCAKSDTNNYDTDVFISYEDPESWYYKTAYARQSGMGGVIIWAASDIGSMYHKEKAGGKDYGRPLWRGLFQGWFQDLSVDVGESRYVMDNVMKFEPVGDLSDPACSKESDNWSKSTCSCPLNAEERPSSTPGSPQLIAPQCKKDTAKGSLPCPNCAEAGYGLVHKPGSTSSGLNPPTNCRRPTGLADPKDYADPLASYSTSQMGVCGSKDKNNDDHINPPIHDDDEEKRKEDKNDRDVIHKDEDKDDTNHDTDNNHRCRSGCKFMCKNMNPVN